MSRHQRLRRSMRSPQRQARSLRNRRNRTLRHYLITYFRHINGGAG